MFVAESIEDIVDHSDIYMNKEIEKGVINYFTSKKDKTHFSNRYADTVNKLMTINESNFLVESTSLKNKIIKSKFSMLIKFGKIYLRQIGSYMITNDDYSITQEVITDKLIYPEDWSNKDINITKYPNGVHYYASIGNVDVVGSGGMKKWNSYDSAMRNAKVFLSKLTR